MDNQLEQLKKEGKQQWLEIVKHCEERKDGPSQFMHESFLDSFAEKLYKAGQEAGRSEAVEYILNSGYLESKTTTEQNMRDLLEAAKNPNV